MAEVPIPLPEPIVTLAERKLSKRCDDARRPLRSYDRPSVRLQEPSQSVDSIDIPAAVERRHASAHIVPNPFKGEVAPFSEGDDAPRLQVAEQNVCRDDQIVAGDGIGRR
jgi:hypothetical protein